MQRLNQMTGLRPEVLHLEDRLEAVERLEKVLGGLHTRIKNAKPIDYANRLCKGSTICAFRSSWSAGKILPHWAE